ncbi:hypothetical protein FKM82_025510 [Ascaphus truei]
MAAPRHSLRTLMLWRAFQFLSQKCPHLPSFSLRNGRPTVSVHMAAAHRDTPCAHSCYGVPLHFYKNNGRPYLHSPSATADRQSLCTWPPRTATLPAHTHAMACLYISIKTMAARTFILPLQRPTDSPCAHGRRAPRHYLRTFNTHSPSATAGRHSLCTWPTIWPTHTHTTTLRTTLPVALHSPFMPYYKYIYMKKMACVYISITTIAARTFTYALFIKFLKWPTKELTIQINIYENNGVRLNFYY